MPNLCILGVYISFRCLGVYFLWIIRRQCETTLNAWNIHPYTKTMIFFFRNTTDRKNQANTLMLIIFWIWTYNLFLDKAYINKFKKLTYYYFRITLYLFKLIVAGAINRDRINSLIKTAERNERQKYESALETPIGMIIFIPIICLLIYWWQWKVLVLLKKMHIKINQNYRNCLGFSLKFGVNSKLIQWTPHFQYDIHWNRAQEADHFRI